LSLFIHRFFFYSALAVFTLSLKSQTNLVPNGSFEDSASYPGIFTAKGWERSLGTPDYLTNQRDSQFHTVAGVPLNARGFQEAKDGESYIGIGAFDQYRIPNYREYIQCELIDSLQMNRTYNISFWVSLADNFHLALSDYRQFGIAFSSIEFQANQNNAVQQVSYLFSDTSADLADKVIWQKIQIQYSAKGGEKFLIIGCFADDNVILIDSIGGILTSPFLNNTSFYYIDDVIITPTTSFFEQLIENRIKIYPNPATDQLSIDLPSNVIESVSLFSMTGQRLLEESQTNQIDLSGIAQGVYFLQLEHSDGRKYTEKLFIK
jgi:hypothetical protein